MNLSMSKRANDLMALFRSSGGKISTSSWTERRHVV